MKFIGNLVLWLFFALMFYSCGSKPPSDLKPDATLSDKLYYEKRILDREIENIDYRLRNNLYSTSDAKKEKEELEALLKVKRDLRDKNIWQTEELNRKKESKS